MKKNTVQWILFICLLFGMYGFAPFKAPITYYVALTGNDQNFGTQQSPWRSIQKCANMALISDTCLISAGTYSERMSVSRSGIRFEAVGKVVIKGFSVTGNNNYIKGFYSLNNTDNAGAFNFIGSGNTVEGSIVEKSCMAGIILRGNNNLALNNEIFDSLQCPQTTSGPDADGMRVFGSGNRIIGNYVHDISLSKNPTAHIDCIQSFGQALINTLIEGNICNVVHAGIQTDSGFDIRDLTVRNNVFVASRPLNIYCDGCIFTNNVFVGFLIAASPSTFVSFRDSKNITFTNNVVLDTTDGVLMQTGAADLGGFNYFYNYSGTAPRRDSGYNYISGRLAWPTDKWQVDPKLDSFYHPLSSSSPVCLPAGAYIGAFPCGAVATPTPSPTKTQTPTPTITKTPTASPTASNTGIPPTTTNTRVSTVENSQTPTVNSPTASNTLTQTATPTRTPTRTVTASQTASATRTPSSTPTTSGTSTVGSITPTITRTPTRVPTSTPQPNRCDYNNDGRVTLLEAIRCYFDRNRR